MIFKFVCLYMLDVDFYFTRISSAIKLIWLQNGHLSQLSHSLFPFLSFIASD